MASATRRKAGFALLLQEHFRLTGSQRARRLLQSTHQLPLVRLEPVHLPCSIADTWAPFLTRPSIREEAEVPEVVRALPLERKHARDQRIGVLNYSARAERA